MITIMFSAAVRFEELIIFILTLNVSWVSACGIVGGYRSHATRGQTYDMIPNMSDMCACTQHCTQSKRISCIQKEWHQGYLPISGSQAV